MQNYFITRKKNLSEKRTLTNVVGVGVIAVKALVVGNAATERNKYITNKIEHRKN